LLLAKISVKPHEATGAILCPLFQSKERNNSFSFFEKNGGAVFGSMAPPPVCRKYYPSDKR